MLPDISNLQTAQTRAHLLTSGIAETHAHSPHPCETEQLRTIQMRKILMKNEFSTSAGLVTCSRGKVLGLNYGSDLLTTVLQT